MMERREDFTQGHTSGSLCIGILCAKAGKEAEGFLGRTRSRSWLAAVSPPSGLSYRETAATLRLAGSGIQGTRE